MCWCAFHPYLISVRHAERYHQAGRKINVGLGEIYTRTSASVVHTIYTYMQICILCIDTRTPFRMCGRRAAWHTRCGLRVSEMTAHTHTYTRAHKPRNTQSTHMCADVLFTCCYNLKHARLRQPNCEEMRA